MNAGSSFRLGEWLRDLISQRAHAVWAYADLTKRELVVRAGPYLGAAPHVTRSPYDAGGLVEDPNKPRVTCERGCSEAKPTSIFTAKCCYRPIISMGTVR